MLHLFMRPTHSPTRPLTHPPQTSVAAASRECCPSPPPSPPCHTAPTSAPSHHAPTSAAPPCTPAPRAAGHWSHRPQSTGTTDPTGPTESCPLPPTHSPTDMEASQTTHLEHLMYEPVRSAAPAPLPLRHAIQLPHALHLIMCRLQQRPHARLHHAQRHHQSHRSRRPHQSHQPHRHDWFYRPHRPQWSC
ncbi:unnamed protein product [Closterium sp. NIES-53]